MSGGVISPIDPLGPSVHGHYEDDLVVVRAVRGPRPGRALKSVRTAHFDLKRVASRLVISHTVPPESIDDDLTGMLADELFGPGWVRGAELFERIFTGVVRSSSLDPLDSWELFYRNTLRKLDDARPGGEPAPHGSMAGYAPVYDHVVGLLRHGSVLELGSCFGFLSLRLARSGRPTTASDVSAGTIHLLETVAPRLGIHLRTTTADAARFPAPDSTADNVLVIHLLEHLEPEHGGRVVSEAVRLAARRVIIAVPLEEEAEETYGHVRTVSLDDLREWGRATQLEFEVHEHHGGWLVIDTPTR